MNLALFSFSGDGHVLRKALAGPLGVGDLGKWRRKCLDTCTLLAAREAFQWTLFRILRLAHIGLIPPKPITKKRNSIFQASDAGHGFGFLHRLDIPSSGLVLCGISYAGHSESYSSCII